MEPSTTYLKYREMVQKGWFFGQELYWISALFKDFEDSGLITDIENRALVELAKEQKRDHLPAGRTRSTDL